MMHTALENVEAMLDELAARVPHALNDGDTEYLLSGIRTAKHYVYMAMREALDAQAKV